MARRDVALSFSLADCLREGESCRPLRAEDDPPVIQPEAIAPELGEGRRLSSRRPSPTWVNHR
jgi:hypothetical protein